ncbi:monocarboxylate transporter 10 [Brachionus plicatilis]|uniref:Monocarboxylate transporter 10 n=1 Tax=Brachionus plicatilis TaxID=10195 RepID=A0A3M7SRB2_BRAPC|nr:monocarboxylate transporter 10 [Brachionus plicatilis]
MTKIDYNSDEERKFIELSQKSSPGVQFKNSNIEVKFSNDNSEAKNSDFIYQEGGWGWIVVICSGFCLGILIGMINNYSLLLNEMERVYNQTENHVVYTAWIGSLSTGVQYIFCSFGSIASDFFGPRKPGIFGGLISGISLTLCIFVEELRFYFLTYGILYGIGQAFLLTSTLAILPHYFNKRISLANGIMNSIGAIVVVILPIFTSQLLDNYGLKATFLFLSILNFITMFMAMTYKPMIPVINHEKRIHKLKSSFGLDVFEKPKFIIFCIASFFGMLGYLIPIVNIDHHSIKVFPNDKPFYINVVFGAASGVAAIVFGKIGDHTKFHRVHYHTLVFLVYGIVQITIPMARCFNELLIQLAILGLMDGVLLCFIVPISCDLAESSKLANHAAGYYHFFISLPSIAGPVIAGKIYSVFNFYDYAFYFGAATSFIGAVILIIFITYLECIEEKKKSFLIEKSIVIGKT